MSVLSLDLDKAINAVWDDHGLDWAFKKYWVEEKRIQYLSLDETEAMAGTPMPYCVYSLTDRSVVSRMTKPTDADGRQEIHNSQLAFNIFARVIDNKSAKDIAAELAEEILKRYGGHPVDTPQNLVLETGKIISVAYQTDFGSRQDDHAHMWTVRYMIKTDEPMAA